MSQWMNVRNNTPAPGDDVLVLTNNGGILNLTFQLFGKLHKPIFSPGHYEPVKHCLFWNIIPFTGWRSVIETPKVGDCVLVRDEYGTIRDAVYHYDWISGKTRFFPFPGFEPVEWREIPELPTGIEPFSKKVSRGVI